MSAHGARVPSESPLENKRLNLIPIGRQLQRTPPTKVPSTHPSEEPAIMEEEDSQMVPEDGADGGQDDATCTFVKEERKSYRRSSVTSASAKMWNADPEAFIQGMQGYQWTNTDLEFVHHAKQQKRAQQLRQELSEVEKTLQVETQRLELAVACRDQLQFSLSKTPSSNLLMQLCKSVLSHSRSSDQLDGLSDKDLLSLLDLQDIQRAVCEENAKISCLERDAAKAQELRDMEEQAMRDMDICEKKISTLQANIDALKVELAGLKTQLLEKEEASKVARAQREVPKTAKARAIFHAPKTPEGSRASVLSQVPEKGRKLSRRPKPSTNTPKETAEKETARKEKAKMARKEKESKKTISKKNAKKETSPEEIAPSETPSQVKTPVETDTEKTKFSNVAQVLEKGRKGSRKAKTPTMAPKDKAQNKTPLKHSTENEKVSMETAEKGNTAPKIKAPKKTTSKKAAEKELAPDETASQVKMAQENTASEKMHPKVKNSNVDQALEKGRKGSRTAKTSTTARNDKPQKKAALTESTENKMTPMEMVDQEMAENGNTAPKIKDPKKTTAKKNAEKELAPDETVKTTEETAPEELPPKVKSLNVPEVLKKGRKGSTTAKLSTIALKEKGLTKTAPRERGEKETAQIEVYEKGKTARQVKAPKKVTSKNTAEKEMAPNEMASQVKTLHENVLGELASKVQAQMIMSPKKTDEMALEETALKVKSPEEMSLEETAPKASKRKAPKKTASKKTADMEMATELTVEGATASKKMTSKVRGPKKMAMQEIAEDEHALQETVLKKGLKGADTPKKEIAVKNKVKKETDPEETYPEKITLKKMDDEVTSMKSASNVKAPKETAEKETILSRRASKEKEPKQKAGKNPSEDEDSLNAAQALGRAQKASKPPNSPIGSDPVTVRRSKRNAMKNPSLSKTIPEKTTRSRRR